jgi:5-methylcytosine-specific restriction endonuclease McrA
MKNNNCIDCGKHLSKTSAKRCRPCFYNWYRKENKPNWSGGKPKCLDCGKEIESYTAERCIECYKKFSKGINAPNYKHGLSKIIDYKPKKKYCACGSVMSHRSKICRECYKKNQSLLTKGAGNNSWRGGITDLNLRIRDLAECKEWKRQVFQRDNYTCTECNIKYTKETPVYLEAHHEKAFSLIVQDFLKEYNQFSPIDDKETLIRLAITYKPFWNIENGKTLCENCHSLKTTRPDKKEK